MFADLKGKVAVITGASRGLGRCLCTYFAKQGVKVAAFARNEKDLKSLKEECDKNGWDLIYFAIDVSDYYKIVEAVDKILDKWERIDILINNAGIVKPKLLEELTKEDIDSVIDTNLKGTIYFTRNVVPAMIKNKSGYIINISSVAGMRKAGPGNGLYVSSKFGVRGFDVGISKYLIKYNIHTTTLFPGGIDTDIWEKQKYKWDKKYLMEPAEIARLIDFILKGKPNTLFKDCILLPVCEEEFL